MDATTTACLSRQMEESTLSLQQSRCAFHSTRLPPDHVNPSKSSTIPTRPQILSSPPSPTMRPFLPENLCQQVRLFIYLQDDAQLQ